MDENKWAGYEAEARRAEAMVFWTDFFQIVGILLTSWVTYALALAGLLIWGLTKIF
jgi:hypothetical protein